MRHRGITAEEAKKSIRSLAETIHQKANTITDTERQSLADAVAEAIVPSIRRPRKKRVKNLPKRPSKIIKSR